MKMCGLRRWEQIEGMAVRSLDVRGEAVATGCESYRRGSRKVETRGCGD